MIAVLAGAAVLAAVGGVWFVGGVTGTRIGSGRRWWSR